MEGEVKEMYPKSTSERKPEDIAAAVVAGFLILIGFVLIAAASQEVKRVKRQEEENRKTFDEFRGFIRAGTKYLERKQ